MDPITALVFGTVITIAFSFVALMMISVGSNSPKPRPSLPQPKRTLAERTAERLERAHVALRRSFDDPVDPDEPKDLLSGVQLAPTYAERRLMLDALIARHPDTPEAARAAAAALDPDASGDGAVALSERALEWVGAHHGPSEAMNALLTRANLHIREHAFFTRALELGADPSQLEPAFIRLALNHHPDRDAFFLAYTTRACGRDLARLFEAVATDRFLHEQDAARLQAFHLFVAHLDAYRPNAVFDLLGALDDAQLPPLNTALRSAAPPDWFADVLVRAVDELPSDRAETWLGMLDDQGRPEHLIPLGELADASHLSAHRARIMRTLTAIRRQHDDGTGRGMLTLATDGFGGGLSLSDQAQRGDLSGVSAEEQ